MNRCAKRHLRLGLALAMTVALGTAAAAEGFWPWPTPDYEDFSGSVSAEVRLFPYPEMFRGQARHSGSLSAEPEYYVEWPDYTSLTVRPFFRLDSSDAGRSHVDLRELFLEVVGEDWELGFGVSKVFWGVTESKHLVDIINQTDLVENIDLEDKLGQPMAVLTLIRDWGDIELFYLPYFRERTFQQRGGRLRNRLIVDTDQTLYGSGAGQWHPDFAVRYSHSIDEWDFGIAHFYGTSRDPSLGLGLSPGFEPVLVPRYELINQTSLDAQYTSGAWLLKLESAFRQGQKNVRGIEENYFALVSGFEYTFFGAFDSAVDVGVLGEYLFDSRLETATDPFQNDLFLGTRVAFNDVQDTQFLLGVIQDLQRGTRLVSLEASRRLGDNWRLNLELRMFRIVSRRGVLFDVRDDDFLQLDLSYFY